MTNSTQTLAEFLLARIDEDEAAARAEQERVDQRRSERPAVAFGLVITAWEIGPGDPRRVLSECEAKRAIVKRWEQAKRLAEANIEATIAATSQGLNWESQQQIAALRTHGWELRGRIDGLQFAIDEYAAMYADHPDAPA